jgi:hypothetical protein
MPLQTFVTRLLCYSRFDGSANLGIAPNHFCPYIKCIAGRTVLESPIIQRSAQENARQNNKNVQTHGSVQSLLGVNMRLSLRSLPYLLMAVSVALFLACMTQDSFCMSNVCGRWPAYDVLAMGWLEPFALLNVGPFVAFSWYANPALFFTWICIALSKNQVAAIFGCIGGSIGTLLGLSFLLGTSVLVSERGSDEITGYAVGYWLWLGSLCLALLSAILARYLNHSASNLTTKEKTCVL